MCPPRLPVRRAGKKSCETKEREKEHMAPKKKTEITEKSTAYKRVNAWDALPAAAVKTMETRARRYIDFLNACRTERQTIDFVEAQARKHGFKPIDELPVGKAAKPGTRVFWINKNRAIGLAVIGQMPISRGMNIVAAHHDVPHLDLKPLPLFEKHGQAFFKTHYYGASRNSSGPRSRWLSTVLPPRKKARIFPFPSAKRPMIRFSPSPILPRISRRRCRMTVKPPRC